MADEISYGDAAAELEAILDEIEGEEVDVDRLAAQVTRAAELIRICRSKIHHTRMEVEEIVARIETAQPSGHEHPDPTAVAPSARDEVAAGGTSDDDDAAPGVSGA